MPDCRWVVSNGYAQISALAETTPFVHDDLIYEYSYDDLHPGPPPVIPGTEWEDLNRHEDSGIGIPEVFSVIRDLSIGLPGSWANSSSATGNLLNMIDVGSSRPTPQLATAWRGRWKVRFPDTLDRAFVGTVTYSYERADYTRELILGYDYHVTAAQDAAGFVVQPDDVYDERIVIRGGLGDDAVLGESSIEWQLEFLGENSAILHLGDGITDLAATGSFEPVVDEWYIFEILVDGDQAELRMWLVADTYPASPTLSGTLDDPLDDDPKVMLIEADILLFQGTDWTFDFDHAWIWGASVDVNGTDAEVDIPADGVTVQLPNKFVPNSPIVFVNGYYWPPTRYTQAPTLGRITLVLPQTVGTHVRVIYRSMGPL